MASTEEDSVNSTLNDFHKAAANHDFAKYFALLADDAVFLGTDASERWDLPAFKAYVKPLFDQGHGWSYVSKERHIAFGPAKSFAWFDEVLQNEKYGTCRGSGVLVKKGKEWKISQYNLAFLIPNELAEKVTTLTRAPR